MNSVYIQLNFVLHFFLCVIKHCLFLSEMCQLNIMWGAIILMWRARSVHVFSFKNHQKKAIIDN